MAKNNLQKDKIVIYKSPKNEVEVDVENRVNSIFQSNKESRN